VLQLEQLAQEQGPAQELEQLAQEQGPAQELELERMLRP